ncbi:MAG: hypothetical protein ABJA86_05825 [Nocardioidaceae bacterium]
MRQLCKASIRVSLILTAGMLVSCGGSSGPANSPTRVETSAAGSNASSSGTPSTPGTPSSAPATEFNPPGDIPDNQVFIPYVAPGGAVRIKVPEGWARSTTGGVTTFTDKLNSVSIEVVTSATAPTLDSVRRREVPQLRSSVSKFALGHISMVSRKAGSAVLVTYQQDSKPDPVTGKVVRDAVERFDFWRAGKEAVLTLSGPVGADNVDPWQIVSDSLHWTGS